MKKSILVLVTLLSSVVAFADGVTCPPGYTWGYDTCGEPNYSCITQALNAAYASDHYENYTPAAIDQILADANAQGHDVALKAAQTCAGQ